MAHRERKQLNFSTIVDFPSQNRVSFLSHSDKRIRNLGCGSFFIASYSRKILNCGRGVGRFLEKNQNFFRCFQNALRKWLLIQPENGCLSLLSPCTRRTPCSNKRERPLQAKLDYFFFYCSIKKPKTLENKGFRRYYLARQKGFEPPAFPLGVDPIRHREVASNA